MARRAKNDGARTNSLFASSQSEARGGVPAYIMAPRLIILLVTLILLLIGFVMVYSSSSIVALNDGESTEFFLVKQLVFAVVGIVGCLILWKLIPYHVWTGPLVWVVWVLALVLLVLTAFVGTEAYGAQRWIYLGFFSLQPSEFAKIAFLLMAAKILFEFRNEKTSLKGALIQAFVLILVPLMILYRTQSDLGTTLICFVGILTIMWLGEIPLKIILGVVGAGIVFAVFASLVGYRQERFVFLNPWDDGLGGLGTGYQLIHSFFAFSEGGLFGVGLGNSREKFLYLPMSETDFIFAIIGEELGLVGALLVILLFLAFLYAGLRIARVAPDNFGTLLAGGFTVMLVAQAFLNIGCVIGALPTTGKPLPFISSGGSSLIASLFMFGIILSVSQGSTKPSVYEQRRADLRVVKVAESGAFGGQTTSRKNPRSSSNYSERTMTKKASSTGRNKSSTEESSARSSRSGSRGSSSGKQESKRSRSEKSQSRQSNSRANRSNSQSKKRR